MSIGPIVLTSLLGLSPEYPALGVALSQVRLARCLETLRILRPKYLLHNINSDPDHHRDNWGHDN